MTVSARDVLLEKFRWIGGHADMWPVFRDGDAFKVVVRALVAPFRDTGVTAVCGIESRGFLLGGAAAMELGVGFVAVRKAAGMFPGEKLVRETEPDYRGFRHSLRIQRSSLEPADRVLLVDDWIETGSQALAVRELVEAAGAKLTGCAVVVNQMRADSTRKLGSLHSLVLSEDLPDA
ncbi:phosphoribosyltransferase [Lentzea tibetensis]|uniref:Phosphoribosyltransferase n=1 Tax=Lentzea tibetensis TaxID=2591470 RepID=A0A563EK16_9PSEU|nr:phosphoribosyltransferase family protein [Lentzea tibetensis]TWP47376.1 phosphoribosyltransferase [Lentzea tibetensis]